MICIYGVLFIEDSVYRLDQIHGPYNLGQWPEGGQAIYIYGLSFFQHLAEKFGEERVVAVSHKFSKNPDQGINRAFEQTLGLSLDQLYEDWRLSQQKESWQLKQQIERTNFVVPRQLTDHGWETANPAMAPTTNKIVYFHSGHYFPSLRLLTASGQTEQLTEALVRPGREFPGLLMVKKLFLLN